MILIAILTSFLISVFLVAIIRKYSTKMGAVAIPRADRWHSIPTPKIGGVGIFLAFGISLTIFYFAGSVGQNQWPLLIGSTIIFMLGVIDDFKQLAPPTKLIGEIIAAAIVVFFGRNIDFFSDEFINILVTFIWLVGITNAINLLDNMDGLAGGVALIAGTLLSILFWRSGNTDLLILSIVLSSSILGFLVYNFPPATIFMGDSGSLFIGFTLSALAIARVPQASNLLAVMGVPTLLFLLPILDTSLVTVTRLLRGQSITEGGRDHTSHRLIAFGLSERQAVLILYGVAIIAGIFGVVIESINYTISLILIPLLLITLTLLTAYLGRLKVVSPDSIPERPPGLFSLVIGLTLRGRILEIAMDLFLISLSYYFAFWIHFGTQVEIINLEIFLNSLPIALAGAYISFFIFGIYRGVWQYLDIRDLLRYGRAVVSAVLLTAIVMSWVYYPLSISYRIFVIYTILLFLGLVLLRSSFTILDRIYSQQNRFSQEEIPVLIYGSGEDGAMMLQWLGKDNDHNLRPVGFVDNDPFVQGRRILGIKVLGTPLDLDKIRSQVDFEGILFPSGNDMEQQHLDALINQCEKLGIWLKRLRMTFEDIE
jgi:UDP-GlcNAc:undecaprenyl-phosphate GlcNAc-1-phosphate transferase